MSEERFEVGIYDNEASDGYCVIDKDKPCHTCRLKYHTVFISTETGCIIVADLLNKLHDDAEQYNIDAMSYQTMYEQQKEKNKRLREVILFADDLLKKPRSDLSQHDYWKFRTLCKEIEVDLMGDR